MLNTDYNVRLSGLPGSEFFDDFADAVHHLCCSDRDGHVLFDGQVQCAKGNGKLEYASGTCRAGRFACVGTSHSDNCTDELIGQFSCPRCADRAGRKSWLEDWDVIDLLYGTRIAGYRSGYQCEGNAYGVTIVEDYVPSACDDCTDYLELA